VDDNRELLKIRKVSTNEEKLFYLSFYNKYCPIAVKELMTEKMM